MRKLTNELYARRELFKSKFGKIINGREKYSFNLKELKEELRFEDAFYDAVLVSVAEHYGFDIEFQGDKAVFVKWDKRKAEDKKNMYQL